MQRTYAKPNREWEGFRPVAYSLHKAWELPLTQLSGEGDQKQERATTVGKLLSSLADQQIQKIDSGLKTEITTASGTVVLSGPSFNRKLAEVLLDLQKDGINYFDTQWFWYDKDHFSDDLMASYSFFVVHKNAIIREQVNFSDYSDSGFDPSVFEPPEHLQPTWLNDPEWEEAWVRYWYRKFYTETRIGQLMVLRPDEPQLHYYPDEGRWTPHGTAVGIGESLNRVQSLLVGIFCAIVIIGFFTSWPGSWLDRWTDKAWCSMRYSANFSNITADKRPPDCDFLHAPIGDKACRYKKVVTAFTTEDRRKLIMGANTQAEKAEAQRLPLTVTVSWQSEAD